MHCAPFRIIVTGIYTQFWQRGWLIEFWRNSRNIPQSFQAFLSLFIRTIQVDLDELGYLLARKITCRCKWRNERRNTNDAITSQERTDIGYKCVKTQGMTCIFT